MAKRWFILWFMALLFVACSGLEEPKPTIRLVVNAWPASELNATVAKLLITQELGYMVELVELDEVTQWEALAKGTADASLEVWPSGHQERLVEYVEKQKTVENGGPLGPRGIIGWYVPQYVVDKQPELASWEGFQNPETAKLFATAETGELGRFLAGPPTWTQYDADIIFNLGLPLQVISAESEEALLAEVNQAYINNEPILFYFYSPHAVFNKLKLVQVALPPYTAECYAKPEGGTVNCSYPEDELTKIFSAQLAEKAPAVYTFLKNMRYDNEAQIKMLAELDTGRTAEQAAQAWIEQNKAVWQSWVKEGE